MAIEENRYCRQIYVNGVPYKVRDEEAQTHYQQMMVITNNLQKNFTIMNNILNANFDNNGAFTQTVVWNKNYEEKVKGSKIPYFNCYPDKQGFYKLEICFK